MGLLSHSLFLISYFLFLISYSAVLPAPVFVPILLFYFLYHFSKTTFCTWYKLRFKFWYILFSPFFIPDKFMGSGILIKFTACAKNGFSQLPQNIPKYPKMPAFASKCQHDTRSNAGAFFLLLYLYI